jgi:hypothetical protein
MKFVRDFDSFLNEDLFTVLPNDSEEMITRKNYLKGLDKSIKEFPTQKVQIDTIFKTFTNEDDKFNKLKNGKFLKDATDPKKMQFKNELLGLWAQVCSFMRQINDVGKLQKGVGNTESLKRTLETQIMDKNKEVNDKLKQMKDELTKATTELNKYNQQKL